MSVPTICHGSPRVCPCAQVSHPQPSHWTENTCVGWPCMCIADSVPLDDYTAVCLSILHLGHWVYFQVGDEVKAAQTVEL